MTQKPHQISGQRKKIKTHVPDLLDDPGEFPGVDHHIDIDNDVPPKREAPGSGSVGVKENIDKMLASGVFVPVHKPQHGLTPL